MRRTRIAIAAVLAIAVGSILAGCGEANQAATPSISDAPASIAQSVAPAGPDLSLIRTGAVYLSPPSTPAELVKWPDGSFFGMEFVTPSEVCEFWAGDEVDSYHNNRNDRNYPAFILQKWHDSIPYKNTNTCEVPHEVTGNSFVDGQVNGVGTTDLDGRDLTADWTIVDVTSTTITFKAVYRVTHEHDRTEVWTILPESTS